MQTSEQIRRRVYELHKTAQAAHLSSALSVVDILMGINWLMEPGDELVLSKGHAISAWYAIKGVTDMRGLPHHATRGYHINVSTGSLGMGISIGAGIALAKPDNTVYVVVGDGELQEGQITEALSFVIRNEIPNIKIFVDCNGYQACCKTMFCLPEKTGADKYATMQDLVEVVRENPEDFLFFCKTQKGKGFSITEQNPLLYHYKPPEL